MAETALAGTGGSIYVPGTPMQAMANIRQWDLTVVADTYDASVLGDYWRHFVPGLRGWNGTITGYYDLQDTGGQLVVFDAMINNQTVVLLMKTVAGGGDYLEGTATITQMQISDPVDNLITIVFTFQGTGSLQHSP